MVYMGGQWLLDYVSIKEFNGIKIRTLESYVEALVYAAMQFIRSVFILWMTTLLLKSGRGKKLLGLLKSWNVLLY